MYRLIRGVLAILLLSSYAPGSLNTLQQNLTLAAQEQLKKTLADHFIAELGKGVGTVISSLAQPGGHLDNPLVRILLPPPLGLAFDVARSMNADPQASLLVVLMNQAAEHAIPNAAPILQAALTHVTPAKTGHTRLCQTERRWNVTRFRSEREGEERSTANDRSVDFTKKGVYSFYTSTSTRNSRWRLAGPPSVSQRFC